MPDSNPKKLTIPAMPLELCLIVAQISSVVEVSMVELLKKSQANGLTITISKIADILFRNCGITSEEWSFCDLMYIRFFEKVNKKFLAGSAFVLHSAFFLTYLSLSSKDDLIRTIVDVYIDKGSSKKKEEKAVCEEQKNQEKVITTILNDKSSKRIKNTQDTNSRKPEDILPLSICESIFRDVLLKTSKSTEQQVKEKMGHLRDYCTATAAIQHGITNPKKEEGVHVDTFVHFCIKTHPTVMWPVLMMQRQLRSKFLGDKFWIKQASSDFYQFLDMSKMTRSVFWFMEVMSKVYPISNKKIVDNKVNSPDIIQSLIERKKTHKLFPSSLYSISTTSRSVLGSEGKWEEVQTTAVRWTRRPSLASDIYSYSHLSTFSSHDRISHHYAKVVKKSKKKDKLKDVSSVLMKSTAKSKDKAKEEGVRHEGEVAPHEKGHHSHHPRPRRFFLERGDSTNSGRGFVSDCSEDDSEDDMATDKEEFLDESISSTPPPSTASPSPPPSSIPSSLTSPRRDGANAPPLRSMSLSPPPSSTIPILALCKLSLSDRAIDIGSDNPDSKGANDTRLALQPTPPVSPSPSSSSRPPFTRTFSRDTSSNVGTPSPEQKTVGNKSPPSPQHLSSPPLSPRTKPPFFRKYCTAETPSSVSPISVKTTTGDNDHISVSLPAGGDHEEGGDGNDNEVETASFPYLSLENLNFHSSAASLATTASVSSFPMKDNSEHGSNFSASGSDSGGSCEGSSRDEVDGVRITPELREKLDSAMKNLNILIIEDSNFQRKLMTRRLMNMMQVDASELAERWPVASACNGEEALSMIDTVHARTGRFYDVLIVDEALDGSGGILLGHEIIEQLRTREDMSRTLMIGCTANIQQFGEEILQAGANAVWAKPMQDSMVIRECIQKLLLEVLIKDEIEEGKGVEGSGSSSAGSRSGGSSNKQKEALFRTLSNSGTWALSKN